MERQDIDEMYMRRCLQLATNGKLLAKPNPMVGAVIVSNEGRIIGEGYHVRCGEEHAEVNAFASVRKEDESLLSDSTIYVSLEPCSHFGKTPPCANLIIKKRCKESGVWLCRSLFESARAWYSTHQRGRNRGYCWCVGSRMSGFE